MKEKKIVLVGAGGHCKVIIDIIIKRNSMLGENNVIMGILDADDTKESIMGIPIIGSDDIGMELAEKHKDLAFIISIGNNSIRKKIVERYSEQANIEYYTAIHPTAIIANDVVIEEGTVVMAGVIVNPCTKVGKHVILNTSTVIEHDNIIHDYVHISPNVALAGQVKVGEGTHVGIGASVIQCTNIGRYVTVGAGAVIINDVIDNCTVVGVPAKVIKKA